MAVSTLGELFAAFQLGDLDAVVGTPEGEQFDFKEKPYPLGEPYGKWELAKDVAAFANRRGGVLVVGVDTEKLATELVERASIVRRVRKELINGAQHHDLIKEWVYPAVRDVRCHWFPPGAGETSGVFVIEVPPQDERHHPFLVKKMVMDVGAKPMHAVGWPRRENDRTVWVSPEEMHRLLAEGMRGGSPPSSPGGTGGRDPAVAADSHLESLRGAGEWGEIPAYFLQAIPPPGGPDILPNFYERTGLMGQVGSPEGLRPNGFHFAGRGRDVRVVEGHLVSGDSGRTTFRLDPDGLFTVGAAMTEDFLGWGLNRGVDDATRINSIVLVEFTLEFAGFVHRRLKPLAASGVWAYRLVCLRFQEGTGVKLGRGRPPGPAEDPGHWLSSLRLATANEWKKSFNGEATAGRDAFLALRRFYQLFGQPETTIPFVQDGEVSEQLIVSM